MTVGSEHAMEVDGSHLGKRKIPLGPDPFANGKRVKFQSFPKATSNLSVSAAASTLPQDEDVDKLGHFASRLEHWKDLNVTDGFDNFVRKIYKISSKLVFVLHNKEQLADILVAKILEGDEIFLEPLFDLTANFAVDIQPHHFWPLFPKLVNAFGHSLLKIKDFPEVVQAGYTALSQIIRMLLRNADSTGQISSLELLKLCVDGLMQEQKGLPNYCHKLAGSTLGQVIRRSKLKNDCITYLLEKCIKCPELAAHVLMRALKTTASSMDVDAHSNWEFMISCIGINNNSTIWSHLINLIAEMPHPNIESLVSILMQNWIDALEKAHLDSIPSKLEVANKMLHLCRGKKIFSNVEDKFASLLCKVVQVSRDETIISKTTVLVNSLCSMASHEAVKCVESIINHDSLQVDEKVAILEPLRNQDNFATFFLGKMVIALIKHKNKAHALQLTSKLLADYVKKALNLQQHANLNKDIVIEFYCDNPISPNTIPNKLLQRLKKISSQMDNNEQEVLQTLYCLLAFRPLDQEMAVQIMVNRIIKNPKSTMEMVFLAVKTLSFIMCPREFFEAVVASSDYDLLGMISCSLGDHVFAAKTLATVVMVAVNNENTNWIQRQILGPLKGQAIVEALLKNLGHPWHKVRFWTLVCLTGIHPKIQAFGEMLAAEQLDANLQTYRDRVKHLTNLRLDSLTMANAPNDIQQGAFCFLLAQLTLNFKLMWEPTQIVVQSYGKSENLEPTYWTSWLEMFKVANLKSASKSEKDTSGPADDAPSIDFCNWRNLLLQTLGSCPSLVRIAEKNNAIICHEFIEVFLRCETQSSDGSGLLAFLTLFGKFHNLQSMSSFEKVKSVAQHCLGHYLGKNREAAVTFFTAAFKELRQHKDIFISLVDAKKWKLTLTSLPVEIVNSSSPKIWMLLSLIIGAKLKQTSREKRKAQMADRKFIVRVIFQVLGQAKSVEFIHDFVSKEAPFLASENIEGDNALDKVKKLGMIFDVLTISAQSAGGVHNVFKDILKVVICEGQLLIKTQRNAPLLLAKPRAKLMEHVLMSFQTLRECEWSREDFSNVLKNCVWPILDPVTSSTEENAKKIHFLAKIPVLFLCWIEVDQYLHLFFEKIQGERNIGSWICKSALGSKDVEPTFKDKMLNTVCELALKISESEDANLMTAAKELLLPAIAESCKDWLMRGKICVDKNSVKRLKALSVGAKAKIFTEELMCFFSKKMFELAPKWKGQVQTEALVLLNCLSGLVDHNVALSAFRLLSSIQGRDGRNLAAQLLFKSLDNPEKKVRLNDNLLLNEEYKKLFIDNFSLVNFLFMFHFGASEVILSEAEFAERNAAGICVRDVLRRAKASMKAEEYHQVANQDIIPVLTKGLMAKNDRVHSEFIMILVEAMDDQGQLGSIIGLSGLQNDSRIEDETNFLDNMKHIQKHRRGRAMRRLLKEDLGVLNPELCQSILLPIIRSYIFNPDYVQLAEIVNSAISAIGVMASKLSWKNYSKLLQQYLSQKPLEPPFQKQRIKVLAAILDNFHFTDEATMGKAKAMLERLLRKKSTTGNMTFFKDGVEETKAADLALYVPIMKILMLLPTEELNNHVSTLIVTVAGQLRSRKLEERQLSRSILCEMSIILGPHYLPHTISVLKAQLQRGYQVHILVYTLHSILAAMTKTEDLLAKGALDPALDIIMDMVHDELFSNLNEEKKVAALVKKTAEARKTVGFGILGIVASNISKSMIASMLKQLIGGVRKSQSSFESGQKRAKAIRSILDGLLKNKELTRPDYLSLGYGLLSGKIANKHKNLDELAFGLLHAAANPGSNDSPLDASEVQPLLEYLVQGLECKDVATSGACLKFIVAITQQSKAVVDQLLAFKDFIELVWKKCQVHSKMKHSSNTYGLSCQALKNLISLNTSYQFSTERIKTICLFFKGTLEDSSEDKSAMQLIGLLLFKYYRDEALEPYLKLLCSSGLKCRDEAAFEVSKAILWRIVQRHAVCFSLALSFYAVNIDITDERARHRSVLMCHYLLEKGEEASTLAKYDTKGLFLHAVATYFEEESSRCKAALEDLIKAISRKKKAVVAGLILDWLTASEVIHVGIGAKIASMVVSDDEKTFGLPGSFKKANFLARPLQLIEQDEVDAQYGAAITYSLQLLRKLVKTSEVVLVKAEMVESGKLANLLIHSCLNVRREAIGLLRDLLKVEAAAVASEWRHMLDNLCEVARSEPNLDYEDDLVDCLAGIAAFVMTLDEDKLVKALLKKTRAFFSHEKINEPKEWTRRRLYYNFVLKVLHKIQDACSNTSGALIFVNMMRKNLLKDRNQAALEEATAAAQELCEKIIATRY